MNNQSFVQRLKHVPFSVLPDDLQIDVYFALAAMLGHCMILEEKRNVKDIILQSIFKGSLSILNCGWLLYHTSYCDG